MALRPIAVIIEGRAGIDIRLERIQPTFDQTLPTNGDGYVLFPAIPDPWDANIHIHAAGFAAYDHVLSQLIPGGLPSGAHQLFIGAPSHPISPPLDILLPPLVSLSLPAVWAGRSDFFTGAGTRHVIAGSTELLLAWRYDREGADAIRPVLDQRRACRFNNLRVLWQKGPGSNGLSAPWLMPLEKMGGFLALLASYSFYCEGVILADCQACNPSVGEQQQRVQAVRSATAGISNHMEQLGNEYEKNGFDPHNFSKPTDRMASNASSVEGGTDAPYWDYFNFSGRREPINAAIREYGPIEFIYAQGPPGWGGVPAICSEGFKPGIGSFDPRDFERAGAQARSGNGGRHHSEAGTAGNSRLFNDLEFACAQAFTKGLLG